MKSQLLHRSARYFSTFQGIGVKRILLRVATVVLIAHSLVYGEAVSNQFVTFRSFIDNITAASPADYVGRTGTRVRDAAAFKEMRQHILTMYTGVHVSHSFVMDSGYFDCVPVEQQPSVRLLKQKQIATPPPLPLRPGQEGVDGVSVGSDQVDLSNQFDEYGNSRRCEDGTIPMRRITLKDMSHFDSLHTFLSKDRDGGGNHGMKRPGDGFVHHYAFTAQNVNNLGGNSNLNLWNDYVNNNVGQQMSLSQQWYAGGSPTQTAEVGWQAQPSVWGTYNSVLFIYWTADGYNNTGCYNLDCGAFTQTNNNWYFGNQFTNYSVLGGTQYQFGAQFYLFQGNWWLGLTGASGFSWVGYYPASIYGGGQMSRHAKVIEYGGETSGLGSWPPMGAAGRWPSGGWQKAAYQNNIWYFDLKSNEPWASLTLEQPSPKCYKDAFLKYAPTSFYFGGPGGSSC
jgi:hypothetical protein